MGLGGLGEICQQLLAHGAPAELPVAVVQDGTLDSQKVVIGSLSNIVQRVVEQKLKSPCLTIVGEVVSLHQTLAWFVPT